MLGGRKFLITLLVMVEAVAFAVMGMVSPQEALTFTVTAAIGYLGAEGVGDAVARIKH